MDRNLRIFFSFMKEFVEINTNERREEGEAKKLVGTLPLITKLIIC